MKFTINPTPSNLSFVGRGDTPTEKDREELAQSYTLRFQTLLKLTKLSNPLLDSAKLESYVKAQVREELKEELKNSYSNLTDDEDEIENEVSKILPW